MSTHTHEHHGHDSRTQHAVHEHVGHDHAAHMHDFRRRFWWSLLLTLPVLALNEDIQRTLGFTLSAPMWVVPTLATVLYLYGGKPFLTGVWSELKAHNPGMMTLIAVAITTAWAYSMAVAAGVTTGKPFFWELATLIDIMLLGHWIEMRSVLGAASALEALSRLMPAEATRLRPDGELETVPVSALHKGDRVVVPPGQRIPSDGVVVEGRSSVDQSMLTGESQPVPVGEGVEVVGGSVNQEGLLTVEVTRLGEESFLAQMKTLVEAAQQRRSRTQDLANRAARWLTGIALASGGLSLAGWTLAGAPLAFAVERAVTVMIIACPHALGLAVPLVVAVSTARAAQQGLLIRDRNAFEQARHLDVVVFDKTGTLTQGAFAVTDVINLSAEHDEQTLLQRAAALEQTSNHPVAKALVQAWSRPLPSVGEFEQLPGEGVSGQVSGKTVQVLSPASVKKRLGVDIEAHEAFRRLSDAGKTVVVVTDARQVLGLIALADQIRPEARETVAQLHKMGVEVHMLTGDHPAAAYYIADQLDLDGIRAQVLPADKASHIEGLQQQGKKVAMVGDGVNDAPALAQADVGVAIGAGTDIAVAAADIVLVRNDPTGVSRLIHLSRATTRKMVQNLWWAAGYNILAIPAAAGALAWAGVMISPAVGAALMSASTVIVALNAQLLRRSPL
ncbi:copper-translocating P-type ATPase [Sulfurivirga sp.]|uniref:copper-translocating P-type ATPase n=1 Tax=Sulfurivirga sp. TaxID=2614236 RepID=UPI0025EF96A5|nr:copper-translocating P-type ATPase [Sulfurivirga sp.]